MRIINIIGLSSFIKLYYKYNSLIPLFVFFNGVLYHSNENNVYLRLYDVFFNIVLCFYILKCHFSLLKYYALVSFSVYLINLYVYDYCHYVSSDISDFIHILGVQYILSLALEKYILLEKKK